MALVQARLEHLGKVTLEAILLVTAERAAVAVQVVLDKLVLVRTKAVMAVQELKLRSLQ
jgi:hypothetical protein